MRAFIYIICCSICFLISGSELFAQRGDGSLYSSFGVGLLAQDQFGQAARIGGVGTGVRSPYFLNQLNPASATSVGAFNFLVDAEVNYKLMNINTGSENININRTNLSLISFWFRTSKKTAFTLGMMPISSVDYSFIQKAYFSGSTTPFDKYVTGYGDINKIYLNFAVDVMPRLSLGIRPYFAFGHINHENFYYTEEVTNGNIESLKLNNRDNYNGLGLDIGAQFVAFKHEDKQLSLGLSYQIPSQLKASKTSLAYLNSLDSAMYELVEQKENLQLGSSVKGGISYQNSRLLLAADYSYKMFSGDDSGYINSHLFSIGGEYMPNFYGIEFLKRVNYSAGIFYDTGYIRSEGSPVQRKGASIGFGFPIQGFTRLNLSYQYVQQGDLNQLSKEVSHGISLNFNFGDIWFQKSRIE
ncbi:PorV/PorQ family protein [Echinicola shivajiensis]|uniref:hypothetical protein n=1 Tax=Echinicola shivajiensis TaxID=1035916 RepID=UPI001BFCC4BC|nr:hypothetical protein [Echinicola shivajiensis]